MIIAVLLLIVVVVVITVGTRNTEASKLYYNAVDVLSTGEVRTADDSGRKEYQDEISEVGQRDAVDSSGPSYRSLAEEIASRAASTGGTGYSASKKASASPGLKVTIGGADINSSRSSEPKSRNKEESREESLDSLIATAEEEDPLEYLRRPTSYGKLGDGKL